jgi:D-alanyl-lipoteichoic acid acyltransferase DltB (MBOAT superfamily)
VLEVLFPTMTFALFFVVVLAVSWRLNDRPAAPVSWKLWVLAASYVFYGWADPRFCLLLAGSTVLNWSVGLAIHRSTRASTAKGWLLLGVAANLAVLGFFKYYGFFVESVLALLEPLGLAATPLLISVALPIGISFFTFCAISYLVDVFRRQQDPVSLLDFGVYLSFFPHLVAGPIVRVSEFVPQLYRRPDGRSVDATRAVRLICRGMFKKVVIANFLATAIVDEVFLAPSQHTNWELLVGAWAYAVQIYADFSGYTDIAIGVALLMGVKFPDNFDRPYSSLSIQEFWRRWHMTLSRWLRDYLYIPLGGNRGGERAEYRNLFLTMLLGGLWHGASWTFVFWGAFHGTGLAVERYLATHRRPRGPARIRPARPAHRPPDGGRRWLEQLGLAPPRDAGGRATPTAPAAPAVPAAPAAASAVPRDHLGTEETLVMEQVRGHPGTSTARPSDPVVLPHRRPWLTRLWVFHFVVVGWIFFRATSFGEATAYLWGLVANWGVGSLVTPAVLLAVAVGMVGQFVPRRWGDALEYRASQLPPMLLAVGVALFLVLVNLLGPQGVAPFIYFDF